ncbi:MAG TPA: ferredoxin--NADP reductase [Leucothrix mucor]|nr:ferredoxin--NADP reductase [Leucothrix mucor]
MASSFAPATVIENHQWTERLFSLKLEAELQPFVAGQFVRLQVIIDGEPLAKSYSLVNSPNEDDAEIYFNIVPDGKVSTALGALRTGDNIEISQPAVGFFTLDEIPDAKHLWMMATGTGLGPYLSILKEDTIWQRFEKIVLVHAVPLAKELVYSDLIQQFQDEHLDQFQFLSIVSQEEHADSLRGRIPHLIESKQLEEKTGLEISRENSHIMLCGNSGMLNDTKKLLKEQRDMDRHLRHKAGHVSAEQYF